MLGTLVATAVVLGATAVALGRTRSQDAKTPTPGGFSARSYVEAGVTYRYQIFFPRDYDATRRWPVVVALHGSGEMGTDNQRQIGVGLGRYVRAHAATFPAVAIFPQASRQVLAPHNYAPIRRLLDGALKEVNADPSHLYLTGHSSGGVMAWNFVVAEPGRYAAVVPVATLVTLIIGTDKTNMVPKPESFAMAAKALRSAPVWIFHGAKDAMVPVAVAREAAEGLKAAGASVKYTEYPEGGHDVWDRAYETPELLSWLFSQHR